MELTLDGIGKGYIVDRGIDALKERGFGNVLVEAGGDLVASGSKTSAQPWSSKALGFSLIFMSNCADQESYKNL
jgi:hypothetical protein